MRLELLGAELEAEGIFPESSSGGSVNGGLGGKTAGGAGAAVALETGSEGAKLDARRTDALRCSFLCVWCVGLHGNLHY